VRVWVRIPAANAKRIFVCSLDEWSIVMPSAAQYNVAYDEWPKKNNEAQKILAAITKTHRSIFRAVTISKSEE
jgi:hypothetical protein